MARKAAKNQAQRNATELSQLHIGSLVAVTIFLIFSLYFQRSWMKFAVGVLPALLSEVYLELNCRPKFSANNTVLNAGLDVRDLELLFDCIWVTWACVLAVSLLGDKAWWLWVSASISRFRKW